MEREDVELSDCVSQVGGYMERERMLSTQSVSNEMGLCREMMLSNLIVSNEMGGCVEREYVELLDCVSRLGGLCGEIGC